MVYVLSWRIVYAVIRWLFLFLFPRCFAFREIKDKIIIPWAHKQFANLTHTLCSLHSCTTLINVPECTVSISFCRRCFGRPISQISECTCSISCNALFRKEKSLVGYGTVAFWNLWIRSNVMKSVRRDNPIQKTILSLKISLKWQILHKQRYGVCHCKKMLLLCVFVYEKMFK